MERGDDVDALRRHPEVSALTLLSLVLTLLPTMAPMGGLILSVLAPFPIVVLGLKLPWRYVLWLVGIEAALLLLLEGASALLILSYYCALPLVMAWFVRASRPMAQTLVWSVGVASGLSLLLLGVYSMMAEQAPLASLVRYIEELSQLAREQAQTASPRPIGGDESPIMSPELLTQTILTLLPAMFAINYLLSTVVNYVVVRWYCSWGSTPIAIDPEDLAIWRASDYLVWIFLGSGAMVLLPGQSLSRIGLNVFLITLAIYFLQGLAIVLFWGRRLSMPSGAKWFFATLIFLFASPLCLTLCTAAGLFDQWVDFRRLRPRPPEAEASDRET